MTRGPNEICARCTHFKMKDHPKHAAVGLGRCGGYDGTMAPLINPFVPWTTPACVRFARAGNMAPREAWIEKQKAKEQNNNEVQTETKG